MKYRIAFLSFICAASLAHASDTIEIDAGILRNADGSSVIPNGALLQIVATRGGATGVFSPPTAGNFYNGDNVLVANFAMNNTTFGAGETDSIISLTLENTTGTASPTTFDAGDALLLRWWTSITYSSGSASRTPQAGDSYGQLRSNTGESGGLAWFAPVDNGTTYAYPTGLNYNTTSAGGIHPNSDGFAIFTVSPVPEPSTYALLGLGLGGLTFGVLRRSRRQRQATA